MSESERKLLEKIGIPLQLGDDMRYLSCPKDRLWPHILFRMGGKKRWMCTACGGWYEVPKEKVP